MKKDITDRRDVGILIRKFYVKVLANEEIGKFFGEAVTNWEYHLERFIDFWESQIFFTDSWEGSILKGHIEVDQRFGHGFESEHFDIWYSLFENTVDEHHAGEKAELAKDTAKNMAKNIYRQMVIARKVNPFDP